uniref:Uncharacterized protein n=1 Tax=Leersia perrieri TaxID=77586 RepID=A0A0D9WKB6_9ORYZ
MALSSARVALRQAFSPSTVAASPDLGALLGRASPLGFHRRLLNSDASTHIKMVALDAKMDLKRRLELKEKEFFHLLEEALKTTDSAKIGVVLEKNEELIGLFRQYKSGPKKSSLFPLNLAAMLPYAVSGALTGWIWRGNVDEV